MGILKVDSIQKRDGTALITDGTASTTLLSQEALRSAGVGLIKINTQTVSNAATVAFTDLDTTSGSALYSSYRIVMDNVTAVSDNAALLYGRFGIGSTPTYNTSSNYNTVFVNGFSSVAGLQQQGASSAAQFWLAANASSGYYMPGDTFEFLSGTMDLFRMGDSNHPPQTNWILGYPISGNVQSTGFGTATFVESSEIVDGTAVQLYMSTGNISGTFTLYGVTK